MSTVSQYASDAQKIQQQTGIPASIILAQMQLESGANLSSELASKYHNLFGMKGTGTAGSANMRTTEVIGGVARSVNSNFAAYKSPYDSMAAYAKLLQTSHYANLKNATTVNDFASTLQKDGYATDPNYASKLISIISRQNLHQYDNGKIGLIAGADVSIDSSTGTADKTQGLAESIFYSVIRTLFILLLVIGSFVFLAMAFPSVAETGFNKVPGGKVLKKIAK